MLSAKITIRRYDILKKKKVQKTNAMRQLDKGKIPYLIHEYAWSEYHKDTDRSVDTLEVSEQTIFKTLVAVGNITGPIVACIPAKKELNLKALARESGNKKVDMLHMKDLEKTTGYIRGECSPIGMKKHFPTFIAIEAKSLDKMVVSAGKRGMQVEVTPDDLLSITNGSFVDITDK